MPHRYVVDTFVAFNIEKECDDFFILKKCYGSLPFLDVLFEKSEAEFITSVYRKLTFTGQYLQWNSYCPSKRKTKLILWSIAP